MAKTYQDGLVKGYKMGVKESKQEALVELQKNNFNKDLPSNEVLFRIFKLLLECKENDRKPIVAI